MKWHNFNKEIPFLFWILWLPWIFQKLFCLTTKLYVRSGYYYADASPSFYILVGPDKILKRTGGHFPWYTCIVSLWLLQSMKVTFFASLQDTRFPIKTVPTCPLFPLVACPFFFLTYKLFVSYSLSKQSPLTGINLAPIVHKYESF